MAARKLIAALFFAIACAIAGGVDASRGNAAADDRGVALPAQFSGGRIVLVPTVAQSRLVLRLWLDSDGSGFVPASLVARFHLAEHRATHGKGSIQAASLPRFYGRFPSPLGLGGGVPIVKFASADLADPLLRGVDGQLGASWFQERVWVIDYRNDRVLWFPDGRLPRHAANAEIPLRFASPSGASLDGAEYPTVTAVVAGTNCAMTIDTGASVALSADARRRLGDGLPLVRGTSFLRNDVFRLWHRTHPQWRYFASVGQQPRIDLIEAPLVRLGHVALRNVWFSTRPDDDVFQGGSVVGKLGATALKGHALMLDYPHRLAAIIDG